MLTITADKTLDKNEYTRHWKKIFNDASNLLIPKLHFLKWRETPFKLCSPFMEYIVKGPVLKYKYRQNLFG